MLTLERPGMKPNESHQKNQVKKSVASKIRERRQHLQQTRGRGFTIEEVADAFGRLRGVPISRIGFGKYELGVNEIAVSDLPFLAEVLEVSMEYFLDDDQSFADDDFTAWYHELPQRDKMTLQAWKEAMERRKRDDADESIYGKTNGKKAE